MDLSDQITPNHNQYDLDHPHKYQLKIRQEPCQAKTALFGLLPPNSLLYLYLIRFPCLILQLNLQSKSRNLNSFSFICHVSLCDSDGNRDKSIVSSLHPDTNIQVRHQTLIGQRTIAGRILRDPEDGQQKIFFIYSDLSIRILGDYRIRCQLINLEWFLWLTSPHINVPYIMTKSFQVNSIFSEVLERTDLTTQLLTQIGTSRKRGLKRALK